MQNRIRVGWVAIALLAAGMAYAGADGASAAKGSAGPVRSEVLETEAGELVLVQEVRLRAPLEQVWAAYTTSEGWRAWVAPKARVDLRVGGTIRTQYDPEAEIGDPGTNTLHIVNYVPRKLLTLRAELQDNWPEVMKRDGEHLTNVVTFEALSPGETRLVSYGIGYRKDPAYERLMDFFIKGNEALYGALIRHVEK